MLWVKLFFFFSFLIGISCRRCCCRNWLLCTFSNLEMVFAQMRNVYHVFCVSDAGQCCPGVQRLFLCLPIAFTSMPDQTWRVSCSFPSLLAIMLACVMRSSWCLVPLVSEFPWYLFAIYTVLLKVNERIRPPNLLLIASLLLRKCVCSELDL